MSDIGIAQRVADAAELCETRNVPKFVGFLSEDELSQAIVAAKGYRYASFGGYDGAVRTVFAVLPDWCDGETAVYPIAALTLSYRSSASLTHRDFLGTLMSFGITRRSVGDILVGEGRAVVFLLKEILPFVKTQLTKVGGEGVTVQEGIVGELPLNSRVEQFRCTVSSMRLDCVVSAICSLSRSAAAEKIEKGLVTRNSVICEKQTVLLCDGDKLSVRGCGRFDIVDTDRRSKKGKIILNYKKYM